MRYFVGLAPVVDAVQNLATNGLRIAFNRLLAPVADAVQNLATNGLRVGFNRLLAPIVGGSRVQRTLEEQHPAICPNNGCRLHQNITEAPIVGLEPTTLGLTVPRSTS